MQDYTDEAVALFSRFAARHDLAYEVQNDAPMEVLWEFPVQDRLSLRITVGLQNSDELNFGVGDFWSYFFPFPKVAHEFEDMLEAWFVGDARILIHNSRCRILQVFKDDDWQIAHQANCLFPFLRRQTDILQNYDRKSPNLLGQ